ncbi:MAG: M23 family metallopeptidase [Alphaproteobacteria bacterium]|nr:M23 family metallopeptidase [Alphaproteobacteria bacterium]
MCLLCIYIVITFPARALEFATPLQQGGLVYGRTQPTDTLIYEDTPLSLTRTGQFVFGIPQDAADITLTLNGAEQTFDVRPIQWREEKVDGLPPEKVVLSPADERRVARDNRLLRQARASSTRDLFPAQLARPVANARISGHFGSRRILNGVRMSGHSGTDYALPAGTPVAAPANGIVVLTHPDMFYSGKTIVIDHGFGVFSSYSHLQDISVHKGQAIKHGDIVGTIGMTGRATGPHLHFTLLWNNVRVDPESVFTPTP